MAKQPLSQEARSILQSKVSRRTVLAGAGAVAGAGALASCGFGGGSDSSSAVRWGNWPLYLDVDDSGKKYPTLEAFTKESCDRCCIRRLKNHGISCSNGRCPLPDSHHHWVVPWCYLCADTDWFAANK